MHCGTKTNIESNVIFATLFFKFYYLNLFLHLFYILLKTCFLYLSATIDDDNFT